MSGGERGGRHGIGIVGLGVIGRRMLANMPAQERLAVVAGWDASPEARAAARADFPWLAIAESAEALVAAPEVGCVYVGTPPASHAALARAAMAAGKAVFCEKPLGVDPAESRALAAEIEAAGVPQAVNLSLAGARGVAEIARALAAGETGAVAGLDIRLRFARWPRAWQAGATWLGARAEGGFVREVGTHFLYLAQRLFGPLALRSASVRYPGGDGAETHAIARLEAGAVPVTLAGSVGGAGPDLVEATVWGAARSYRLTDFYRLWRSEGGTWEPVFPEIADPALDAYRRQLDLLAAQLDGGGQMLPTFREALTVQETVEAILAAGD